MRSVFVPVIAAVLVAFLAAAIPPGAGGEARADLTICNDTNRRVGIAVGHHGRDGLMSEGWWNFTGNECQPILRGDLIERYYYFYAVDYDLGGTWGGDKALCTSEGEFEITGVDCSAGDSKRTGFHEMDTGGVRDWTAHLSLNGWSAAKADNDQ